MADAVLTEALARFDRSLERAMATGRRNMTAMALATASSTGRPSVRHVLLRDHGPDGFVFFTDRRSEKARDLLANPVASTTFYWEPIEEQVRIDGRVEEVDRDVVDADFASRGRESQLLLWGPAQSTPIDGRETVIASRDANERRFGPVIDPPPTWTGFRLVPHRIEFWAGSRDRIHERRCFAAGDDGWTVELLAP